MRVHGAGFDSAAGLARGDRRHRHCGVHRSVYLVCKSTPSAQSDARCTAAGPELDREAMIHHSAGASYTPDRHRHDVIDLHCFLNDERFAVFDANQVAIETRDGFEAVAYFLRGRKEL